MSENFSDLILELPRWNNGEGIDAESWIGCGLDLIDYQMSFWQAGD